MSPNHRRLRAGGSGILVAAAMTGLLAAVAAGLAPRAGAAGLAPGAGAAGPVGPVQGATPTALTSTTLTSVGSDGAAAAEPNARAAIAENGRYVAFQSQATLNVSASVPVTPSPSPSPSFDEAPSSGASSAPIPNWRIYVRDQTGQTTSLLSDPGPGNATAPTISADGKLVSYLVNDGIENTVEVVNRQATGQGAFDTAANLAVKPVTGTANDLQFERIPDCPDGFGTSGGAARTTPCGPKLSADGSTLVYPAQLSPVSPDLNVTDSGDPIPGNIVDFGVTATDVEEGSFQDVDYTATGTRPVTFTPAVTGPFTLTQSTESCVNCCDSPITLAPGATCHLSVSFNPSACPADSASGTVTGTLQTNSDVPAGQTEVTLVVLCDQSVVDDSAVSRAPGSGDTVVLAQRQPLAPSCPAVPHGLHLVQAPALVPGGDNAEQQLRDLGSTVVGQPYVIEVPVQAPGGSPFLFTSQDCGFQLVDPAGLGLAGTVPSPPDACVQGQALAANQSCNAYVLVSPGAVATDVAGLVTPDTGYPTVTYLTATAVSDVIVARHDTTGPGGFAASPSTVVSTDGQGNVIPDASQPSVSSTGRYVAFTAPVPSGSGEQVGGSTSVWRHDTDASGNQTYHPGATIMVSCLPGGQNGSCSAAADADSPSLSGDGSLVAFATVASNGQVYTRDVTAGTSALASVPAAGGTANGDSYAPALSQDGSTVAYISTATDLTGTATTAGAANLWIRDLGPGSAAGNELASPTDASLPEGDDIALPGIDAHGGLVAFQTSQQLLSAAPTGIESIYTFERRPSLVFSPPLVSFGSVQVGSAPRTQLVTVTNTGPGPGAVTVTGAGAPFGISNDTCAAVVLYQDSTCTFTATLTPQQTGQDMAGVTVTATDDSGTSLPFAEPVTATVTSPTPTPSVSPTGSSTGSPTISPTGSPTGQPRLSVNPGVAPPGQVTQVTGSGFAAGQQVTLSWKPGLGQVSVVADKSGGFTTAMVIFPDDFTGPRVLQAADASGTVLATVNFLVQQPPMEPPFKTNPPSGGSG
jgi:Abnormal spindle-like microcephaly-assoc'd, ASPM-SPD-2-Hydin/WD40-like Beta Propeller Repeat